MAAALVAQCLVTDDHDQVAAKFIGGFAARVFDLVIAGAVAELPILEFPAKVIICGPVCALAENATRAKQTATPNLRMHTSNPRPPPASVYTGV
jgi:hypothetical protein